MTPYCSVASIYIKPPTPQDKAVLRKLWQKEIVENECDCPRGSAKGDRIQVPLVIGGAPREAGRHASISQE